MQLFVFPGACSFASHVLINELDLPAELIIVKLGTPNSPLLQINPLGRVPTLKLDDGTVITENTAILPYLADLVPNTPLFAPAGTSERAQIQSWIGYLNSEIHAACFRAINRPHRYINDEAQYPAVQAKGLALLTENLQPIIAHLQKREWLVGERFTIADAYLGVFLSWLPRIGEKYIVDERLIEYHKAYESRESVKRARAFEQLELNR
ncbi:MAG: glutathione S-transferase [Methylococcaceae bacterium]|nr:glutathione S-transferase [Methylococcaceae bacterium]